jgi:anti-repressor protein
MELIKIEPAAIGGETVNAVDARSVHSYLGVKQQFSDWIKLQIERARLVEGKHFGVLPGNVNNPQGGRPSIEYALSIDAAKHIAMMSRSKRGCEIRDYFIECERVLKSQAAKNAIPDLMDPDALMAVLLKQIELRRVDHKLIEQQRQTIESNNSRVAALQSLSASDGSLCITDAAKALGKRPSDVFTWLNKHQWIYKRSGCEHWIPYANRVQAGMLEIKATVIQRGDGTDKTVQQARVTRRGLAKLAELMAPDPARATTA